MLLPAKRSRPFIYTLIIIALLFGPLIPAAMAAVNSWTQMSPTSKPSARNVHAMASIGGDQALLFGGYDGGYDDETWLYDLSSDSWTQMGPASKPSARGNHAMAFIGGDQVLLFGGYDGSYFDETWVYDLSDDSWTQMGPAPKPSARRYHAMVPIGGDQVLLFGGHDGSFDDETWVYDLSADSWTQKGPASNPVARGNHAMASLGGDQVLLFGGYDGNNYDESWVYDLSADSWTEKSPASMPSARRYHGMANVGGDQVLLFGGWDSSRVDDTWVYDLSADNWTQMSPASKPSARTYPAMVPIGSEQVLLFGGYDGSYDDETWVFNLDTADLEVSEAYDSGSSSYTSSYSKAIDNKGGRFAWGKSLIILPSGLIPSGYSNCRLVREVQEDSNIASGFSSGDAIYDIYILCDEGRLSALNQSITICLRPRDGNSSNKEIFHQHGNNGSFTALPSASGPAGYVCGSTSQLSNFTIDKLSLPNTGFVPGLISEIGNQAQDKAYSSTSLTLEIPKLGMEMPIVAVPLSAGGWDTTWLNGQAGYLQTTSFPTLAGNSVLTGHVWDANNNPGPFAKLKNLQHGDQFSIHAWGLEYTYEVRTSRLVSSWNLSVLGETELDWVTLITCESFDESNGSYLYRRAVQAVLVSIK